VQFCTGWCVLLDEMSAYTPPRPASRPPLDAEEEARELDAFLRAQDPVDLAAADWHMRWEQGLDAEGERQLQGWLAFSSKLSRNVTNEEFRILKLNKGWVKP